MNLEDMQATANGRFCGKCNKEVFDLTNCSLDEVRALQEKHGPLCGSIRMAQVATVAIALASAACEKKPDNTPAVTGLIEVPPSQHEENAGAAAKPIPHPTTGSICLPPIQQDGKSIETPEIPPESIRGRIKLPRKNEESKADLPDQKPSLPSE